MSRLQPGLILLDKGLNLQAPKIAAPEGSVLDMLNYEHVDFQGQKRIDGYVRYDGKVGSYLDDYYVTVSEGLFEDDPYVDADGNLVGIVLSDDGVEMVLAIIDYTRLPAGQWGSEVHAAEEHYENLLQYNQILRNRTGALPGPIAGLHWFNDRLYAVSNLQKVALDPQGEASVELINRALFDENGVEVGYTVTVGSWGDAAWTVDIIGNLEADSYVYDEDGGEFYVVSVELLPSATFYESRTELQSLIEDGTSYNSGWRPVHLGWEISFEDGVSLYGSLPSLNQNIQGLGVQGPTTISGSTGRPLTLSQGNTISGEKAQVNGWKSSQTPTNFTLNPSDVWELDTNYTYADAYISWDGDTGQVSAPGVTTATLTQYSATNTVEVEIA